MSTEPTIKVDLIEDSKKNLMALCFSKSTSINYPLAISIASGAYKYQELKIGNATTHFVVFQKSRDDASRAYSLLGYIQEWKGVQNLLMVLRLQTFM